MSPIGFASMNRLFLSLLIPLGLLTATTNAAVEGHMPVLLQLNEPALVPFYLKQKERSTNGAALGQALRQHAKRLANEQDRLAKRLNDRGVRVTKRFTRVTNALRVRVAPLAIPGLAKLPGVQRVERPRAYSLLTKKSVPAVGAKTAWGTRETGFDGKGIRIAVIDSGVDYTHAMFGGAGTRSAYKANDASEIEPGSFPTAKVDGWDFAGKNYDGEDDEPQPDGDPLDRSGYGHGTHVAGIIGGVGVTTKGKPYDGPYHAGLNYDEFKIRPGVAPGAKLFALKIFGDNALGSTGLVLDALEWCVDPNADDKFDDRMDVINLSLGSTLGLEEKHEIEAEVFRNLTNLGCVVVAAAGNSNNNNFYLVSAPGVERSVISVGSTKLDGKAQRIAAHSARGPSSPHSLLKPEILAPGELIQSAKMGTGSDGAWFTGSSLATPHVSGAAALVRQAYPERTATQIKSLLLNTANPIAHKDGTPYPESLAGAGFLDVAQAVNTPVTAMAEGTDGLTTLSLGDLAFSTPWESTRQIRVTNHGKAAVSFELSVEETVTEPGFTIELPEERTIQVPANDHRLVTVTFKANPKQFDRSGDPLTPEKINGRARSWVYEVSGKIRFDGDDRTLRVPYHAVVRAASKKRATVRKIGLPEEDSVELSLSLRGHSAHPKPLVSVFELAAISPPKGGLDDPADIAADVLAVGVASDYPQVGSVEKTTLYFAIANAGNWTNPHSFIYDPHLQIDTDFNGWVDHELASCSNGGLLKDDLTKSAFVDDVFLSILIRVPRDERGIADAGFLNVFPPDRYDTVPFNNRVMVLPVPAKMLGLSESKTDFDFRVLSLGAEQYGYPEIDRTSMIRYDITEPVVHTAFGIDGTVMHDSNEPVRIAVDRRLAKSKNVRPAVMIMHHMNTDAHKVDLVELKLDTDDVDGDGLVDVNELALYGDLTTTDTPLNTDTDKDGATDAHELAAGTDPKDPNSVFLLKPNVRTTSLGPELKWSSVADKSYLVQRTPALGQAFETVSGPISATPPLNTFVDKTAPLGQGFFYRILKP
ncbi:MAG TPA: hypothetical protein DEA68_00495 [Verrucomicrobiales bacterium]|nr:hypothetical protein [Verrucomicrobiales bacterium]